MSNQWREKPVHFFKCNCPCHKKILGQSYEKLRIRSDLGTSEENLKLNLRKTFDQCSIRSFGSANYPIHPEIFPANLLRKLTVTTSAHPQIRTSAFYPRPILRSAVYIFKIDQLSRSAQLSGFSIPLHTTNLKHYRNVSFQSLWIIRWSRSIF